jgi:hypothetical protein
VAELKIGTEVDGKKVISMFQNQETRNITVNFEDGDSLVNKQHESIEKILNHKWEK